MSQRNKSTYLKIPPGPRSFSPLGHAVTIQRDAMHFTQKMWSSYGDVVRFRLLTQPATLLFHPDHVQRVLQENHFNYDKQGLLYQAVSGLLGNGLFTNNGNSWRGNRRLIQPLFHKYLLGRFADIMTSNALAMAERWKDTVDQKSQLDISGEMAQLTLQITAQALFSTETPEVSVSVQRAFATVWDAFSRYVALPVPPLSIPTPRNLRIRQSAHQLDQIIYKMIEERRQKPLEQPDLLQLLLNAADDDKSLVMSDQQIRDELVTMFVAGHETTAHALSWFWYVLSEYPDMEKRVHDELDEVLGRETPTVSHLSRLPYLHMVLNETLRLYSPSFSLARHAITDDEVGGYHIPRGSLVFVTPYFTHRHPDFWPDPDHFDPERFIPETKRHKFAYFPFGGGPRICIGNNFALMEMPLIIAVIAQRYRLRLMPGTRVEPWASLTMRPRYGLPMLLQQRL